jgi:hypothetical protein
MLSNHNRIAATPPPVFTTVHYCVLHTVSIISVVPRLGVLGQAVGARAHFVVAYMRENSAVAIAASRALRCAAAADRSVVVVADCIAVEFRALSFRHVPASGRVGSSAALAPPSTAAPVRPAAVTPDGWLVVVRVPLRVPSQFTSGHEGKA